MTDLTYQDVLNILRLIDTAGFADLDVEFEGTRIKVTRHAGRRALGSDRANGKPSAPNPHENRPVSVKAAEPATPQPAPAASDGELGPGQSAVKPPMEGTFYASPAPGQPPFAKVGQRVRTGDQLGTVEVMKLFTPVTAPCDGTIVKILVSNEQVVAKDQLLMVLAPDGGMAS